MRPMVFAALAFVGGLALAVIGFTPPQEALAAQGLREEVDLSAKPLSPRLAQAGVGAPTWREGDAWRVSFDGGDPVCWMVVAVVEGGRYEQGVTCGEGSADDNVAANIAALGGAWIGTFNADLEGLDDDEAVRFYDWPLRDGKTWTTEWYGEEVEVVARYGQVNGPGGPEPGYFLTMSLEDEAIIEYDYVPSLEWWSRIEFVESDYVFRVVERAEDWEGPVTFGVAEIRYAGQQSLFFPSSPRDAFVVTEEDELLVVLADRGGGASAGRLAFRGPDGLERWSETGTSGTFIGGGLSYRTFAVAYLDAEPGTWSVEHVHAGFLGARVLVSGVALTTVEL